MHLALPNDVRLRMASDLRRGGSREIGGLIMAEQIDTEGSFRVVDFSVDAHSGSRAYFERRPEDHQAALEAFFERHGGDFTRFNYLGEWHSHPCFPAYPSLTDITTMHRLVNSNQGIDFAVLMIVRLRTPFAVEGTANLFMRGHRPRPVRLTGVSVPWGRSKTRGRDEFR